MFLLCCPLTGYLVPSETRCGRWFPRDEKMLYRTHLGPTLRYSWVEGESVAEDPLCYWRWTCSIAMDVRLIVGRGMFIVIKHHASL